MKKPLRLLAIALVLLLTACGRQTQVGEPTPQNVAGVMTWQEQYDLGMRYLTEGSYQEAIIAFTAAIEIDPKQVEVYISRGQAYIGAGETELNLSAALSDFQSALSLNDKSAEAYLGAADAHIRMGNYEKALELLRKGYEITKDQAVREKLDEIESGMFKDSSGKLRRVYYYNADGAIISYGDYTYDEMNVEKYSVFSETGELLNYQIITPDENGRAARVDLYSGEGSMLSYQLYEYENDRIIRMTEYLIGGITTRVDYEYDSNGTSYRSLTYLCSAAGEELSYYNVYQLNENGDMIRNERYNANDELEEYWVYGASGKNHFDKNGELIDYSENS